MVKCDNCSLWHHYTCVGVSEEIEHVSWSCKKCLEANLDPESNPNTQQNHPRSTESNIGAAALRTEEPQQHLELLKAASRAKSASSRRSSRARAQLELQKLEELRLIEEEEYHRKLSFEEEERARRRAIEEATFARKREILERKYQLLDEMASETSSVSAEEVEARVSCWVQDTIVQQASTNDMLDVNNGPKQPSKEFIPQGGSTPKAKGLKPTVAVETLPSIVPPMIGSSQQVNQNTVQSQQSKRQPQQFLRPQQPLVQQQMIQHKSSQQQLPINQYSLDKTKT